MTNATKKKSAAPARRKAPAGPKVDRRVTQGKTRMTPSEAFVETLVAQGVTDVFGIVGSAYMDALDLFPSAGSQYCVVASTGTGPSTPGYGPHAAGSVGQITQNFARPTGAFCRCRLAISRNRPISRMV